MSKASLVRLKLSQYRVVYRYRGKRKVVKPSETSIRVPKGVRKYTIEFKPAKRWLKVKEVERKGKAALSLGPKKLQQALRTPDKLKRRYLTAYEAITEKLEGAPWQLRPRAQRVLPQWEDQDVFFNTEADRKRTWKQIAVWYAIEAVGFSDGETVEEDEKAYYVDAAYQNVPAQRLTGGNLSRFNDLISPLVIGADGVAQEHNKLPGRRFDWKESYILLGVEGVDFEVLRTGRVRRKAKGARSRRKVSRARAKARVRHRDR